MSSRTRRAANRINAKRSTGPRTAAGKSRVAKNALRHGLAAGANSGLLNVEPLAHQILTENPTASAGAVLAAAEAQAYLLQVLAAKEDLILNAMQARADLWDGASPRNAEAILGLALLDCAARLRVMDEYERKARSRRKKAFRALTE